jgi:sulfotransferase
MIIKKKYFFLSGLPRSGSTLLSCILNQNPDIYCSNESPICDLLYQTEMHFNYRLDYKSSPNEIGRQEICKSIIQNYYNHKSQSYIIDKFRSWGTPANLHLIRKYITEDVKIICPVRPIVEILSSFIKLFDENEDKENFVDRNITNHDRYIYRPLNDVRCDELMALNGPIDTALFSLSQSKLPENKEVFHFIEYDDLIYNTEKSIRDIYDFLNIKHYSHNFESMHQSDEIDDRYHNLPMHKVREKIEKKSIPPSQMLSEYITNKYRNYEFWRE